MTRHKLNLLRILIIGDSRSYLHDVEHNTFQTLDTIQLQVHFSGFDA